jgi:hypothetical protein
VSTEGGGYPERSGCLGSCRNVPCRQTRATPAMEGTADHSNLFSQSDDQFHLSSGTDTESVALVTSPKVGARWSAWSDDRVAKQKLNRGDGTTRPIVESVLKVQAFKMSRTSRLNTDKTCLSPPFGSTRKACSLLCPAQGSQVVHTPNQSPRLYRL